MQFESALGESIITTIGLRAVKRSATPGVGGQKSGGSLAGGGSSRVNLLCMDAQPGDG
jgi:hypothetical protein